MSASGYVWPQAINRSAKGTLRLPGTAIGPVPGVRSTLAVRQHRRNAPRPGQARAIGMATNFVPSSDFNRINTVRLPFLWASLMALRTSAGVVTFFPPTSRMTSPVLKPCSEASPLGSTSVTTTPSEPLPATCPAGASIRPRCGPSAPLGPESGMVARASRSFGNSPSVSEMLFFSLLRHTVSLTLEPESIAPICLARSRASLTAWPLTAVMTSPERMPALAAGLSACGSVTSAPSVPRVSAMSVVARWICTPRQPRLNLPAEPAAADHALVLELGDDRLHRLGRNIKGDADRSARRREDRGVDPDDVAVHVEGRAAGIAFVDRRVNLDEVVVRAGANVTAASRDDAC